jgi:hypothetical protein
MKQNRFSDGVYEILLWEFMQFATARVRDSGFVERTLESASGSGQISEHEVVALSQSEDALKAVQVMAPTLFIMFVMEHPQMFDEREFLDWVKSRSPSHRPLSLGDLEEGRQQAGGTI